MGTNVAWALSERALNANVRNTQSETSPKQRGARRKQGEFIGHLSMAGHHGAFREGAGTYPGNACPRKSGKFISFLIAASPAPSLPSRSAGHGQWPASPRERHR